MDSLEILRPVGSGVRDFVRQPVHNLAWAEAHGPRFEPVYRQNAIPCFL